MHLPWILDRLSLRRAARRKQAAPLRVRQLERRRVLNASVTDIVFAPADLDAATKAHDSNEGTSVTASATASGSGQLFYEWTLRQGATLVAQGFDPTFTYKPLDDANYTLTVRVTDSTQASASRTEDWAVHNVRPVLTVATDQNVNEGAVLDLGGFGAPALGGFIDDGKLDTHTATVDWGDGSGTQPASVLEINGSGAVLGSHTYNDNGLYTVHVTVMDDDGGSDTQSFAVTVGNVAPTADLTNNGPVDEGSNASVTFSNQFDPSSADTATGFHYAYDVDNDGTFDVGDGTYAGSTTSSTQPISAALLVEGPGTHTVRAWIIDKNGGHTEYFTNIAIKNVPPTLMDVHADDVTIDEGESATITMTINDPGAMDVFEVDVNWQDGPADTITGLGLANASGTVGGTDYQWDAQSRQLKVTHLYRDDDPTATMSDPKVVALTVRDDDLGESGPYNVNLTVSNVRPVLEVAVDQSVLEGQELDLAGMGAPPLASFMDDGVLDTHTATVDWGDGSGPQAALVSEANGSGEIHGTHTYTDNGLFEVIVTVTDDDGGSDTHSFFVTVGNVAPTANFGNSGPVPEGSPATVSFTGQFDPSTVDTAAGFRYAYDFDNDGTFDLGDGSYGGSVVGASQMVPPALLVEGPGSQTVRAVIIDKNGGSTEYFTTVEITNVDPTLIDVHVDDATIDEGNSATITMTINDPGATDVFEVEVNWQDGPADTITGLGLANASGTVGGTDYQWDAQSRQLTLTHLYRDDNPTATMSDPKVVTLSVRDDDSGHSGPYNVNITVNNVHPVLVVADNQNINEGAVLDLTAAMGGSPLAGFIDDGKLDTHTATVDWGDGAGPQAAVVMEANGSGAVLGQHTYADDGVYMVTVTITDDDGGADSHSFQVTVENVDPMLGVTPSPTTIDEGQSVSFDATFSDPGFDNPLNPGAEKEESFTYDVDWGDGRDPITGMSVADTNGLPGVDSTGMFSGSHTYADNGTYTVTVTIHDDDGGVAVQMFVVTVENVDPMLGVTPSPTTIDEGQSVSFDATFSDPGFDNPLNPGAEKEESFTYDVDWGDGRDAITGMSVTDSGGMPGVDSTGMFSGSHTYADNGTYTVTVTIHDDDGGVAVQMFVVTVENVDPMLTGTSGLVVNEGTAITLTGLGVGLSDPGFDNPLNTVDPANGGELSETFEVTKINWGDGSIDDNTDADLTDLVSIVNRVSGGVGVLTTAQFTHAPHTFADNGTYTVTVTIKDDDGNFVDRTFQITVNNVVPTLVPTANQTVNESQDLSLPVLATFTDPGFDNPLNPSGATSESFSYYLDWGDGRELIGSLDVADTNGSPGVLSSGSFGGMHNYADNGVYTVIIRIADDDMTGNFAGGVNGTDFVEQTFTVTVSNLGPAFALQPDGSSFQGDDVSSEGLTTIRVAFNDPGYDNPLNVLASNGGEQVETFNHVVQWGDGTVDAIHQYTSSGTFLVTVTMTPAGGSPQQFAFNDFNSANPVLTLVSSQQLNDPGVVPQVVTYVVDWGDGHVETFQISGLLNPGLPLATDGLTTLLVAGRDSGNADTLTTGSAEIQHRYLGPPDPLHPTDDIIITLSVYDDDGASVTDTIAVSNPGIQNTGVAIDTTPDVARLDLTQRPMSEVFIPAQGGLTQQLQIPDVRGGGGEVAATTERYLELRVVNPDGTESEGFRIKDEALLDLRKFFATLPDGRYAIYLVRTENQSERLVIEVDVRHGRVIDVSDDSEGTRDRPPTGEEESTDAVPLDQNQLLEPAAGGNRQGDSETRRQREVAETTNRDSQQLSLSPPLLVSVSAAALAAQPWSQRVDAVLAEADETAWKRLRRAGRTGRAARRARLAAPRLARSTDHIEYNRT